MKRRSSGFTIVELLIVIVIIGILAALVIVSYNGMQQRTNNTKQDTDVVQLVKAIILARESSGKVLKDITGYTYSGGACNGSTEPKDLPKTHLCWTRYYTVIDTVAIASGANLNSLKEGDARGNPYFVDENEGEQIANPCLRDRISAYAGSETTLRTTTYAPNSLSMC